MKSIDQLKKGEKRFSPSRATKLPTECQSAVGQLSRSGTGGTVEARSSCGLEAFPLLTKIIPKENPRSSVQSCITLQGPQMMALEDGRSMNLIEELRSRTTYLSTNEVMAILGKRRNTLCQWVRTKKIGAIRTGNAYLFDPHTLADWLSDRETKTATLRRAA